MNPALSGPPWMEKACTLRQGRYSAGVLASRSVSWTSDRLLTLNVPAARTSSPTRSKMARLATAAGASGETTLTRSHAAVVSPSNVPGSPNADPRPPPVLNESGVFPPVELSPTVNTGRYCTVPVRVPTRATPSPVRPSGLDMTNAAGTPTRSSANSAWWKIASCWSWPLTTVSAITSNSMRWRASSGSASSGAPALAEVWPFWAPDADASRSSQSAPDAIWSHVCC